jgi:hypothetical protein
MTRWDLCSLALAAGLLTVSAPARAAEAAGGVSIDKEKRTVTVEARIAPRKINDPRYTQIYPIEVIACWPFPRGQKAHETVVTIEAKPSAVHKALEELGLKPGKPARGGGNDAGQGPAVNVYVEVPGPDGRPKRLPIEKVLIDPKSNKTMPKVQWRFTGSVMTQPDPNKPEKVYGADLTGTLLAIFPVTDQTVFQTNLTMKEEKYVKLETDKRLLPKEGTPVKLILEVPAK